MSGVVPAGFSGWTSDDYQNYMNNVEQNCDKINGDETTVQKQQDQENQEYAASN